MPIPCRNLAVLMLAAFCAGPALGREIVPGPIPAQIIEVIDGDSIKVLAQIWPGNWIAVVVRVRGIDSPELKGRCEQEQILALAAKEIVNARIGGGQIMLSNIEGDKYFGRVLADVTSDNGADLAGHLLQENAARPYRGGRRQGWCEGR